MFKSLTRTWNSYKRRLVPWIMYKTPQNTTHVANEHTPAHQQLLFTNLTRLLRQQTNSAEKIPEFTLCLRKSNIHGAGTGVFVHTGRVSKHQIAAVYPGTVYMPSDPKLFQSLNNPYMFRCQDRVCVDGKPSGLSRSIFRSCGHRDRVGPYEFCDMTWLSEGEVCTGVNVGQFVNNQGGREFPQNVEYREVDVATAELPLELRSALPNVNYCGGHLDYVRAVVLVATRELEAGEELFADYFTIVKTVGAGEV